ncbi:MAG: HPr family phosphocarrier protein [Pseudomonadota bacterium]
MTEASSQVIGSVLDVLIINKRGLHARASAKFVQMAESFPDTQITVSKGGETVGGLSIMGLMLLAAGPGTNIKIAASGPRADEAVRALKRLVDERFGEEE